VSTSHTGLAAYRIAPSVAVRPEAFGALIYDYDTRRLAFLKQRSLADVVRSLADHPTVDGALDACGVPDDARAAHLAAIDRLVSMGVLIDGASA